MGDTIYKPQEGERVRVVYEGVVKEANAEGLTLEPAIPVLYDDDEEALVSIEKIEPPVEVFKPGDVVRERWSGHIIALLDKGWVRVKGDPRTTFNGVPNGALSKWGAHADRAHFSTPRFERVSIG